MSSKNLTLFAVLLLMTALAAPGLAEGGGCQKRCSQSQNQSAAFDGMVEDYLAIQTALAGDSIEGVDAHATAISKSARGLSNDFDLEATGVQGKDAEALVKVLPGLADSAVDLSKAKDIIAARDSFGPLSDAMIAYRELVTGDAPNVAYCPMVEKNWMQNGKEIANPYYGSSMLHCGSIVSN